MKRETKRIIYADVAPGFYVTCIDQETDRRASLAGPFKTHDEALARVDDCRRAACEKYPAAHWYLFGTAKVNA